MRIIVKESQYNKILLEENTNHKLINDWSRYLMDRLYPYLEEQVKEKNIVDNNLDKVLGKYSFFNKLPIKSIVVNKILGENKNNSYIIEKKGKIIEELEIDFMVTDKENITKEDISDVFRKILNEQIDKMTFADGVEEKIDELELYNEISKIDTVFKELGKTHIHVEGVDDYKVTISQKNIDDVANDWDKIKKYLENLKEIEKVEGNIIHFKQEEVKDGENLVTYVDLEGSEGASEYKTLVDIDNELLFTPKDNSSGFGWRNKIKSLCDVGESRYCKRHKHVGQDYAYPKGTYIYLFKPGKVVDKGTWSLTIEHTDGTKSRYLHCDEFFVNKGDKINKGTLIGTVGNKGPSAGNHLHLEYIKDVKNVDPVEFGKEYLKFLDKDNNPEDVKK